MEFQYWHKYFNIMVQSLILDGRALYNLIPFWLVGRLAFG